MKLELEGEWSEIQEVCRRIAGKPEPKSLQALDDEPTLESYQSWRRQDYGHQTSSPHNRKPAQRSQSLRG